MVSLVVSGDAPAIAAILDRHTRSIAFTFEEEEDVIVEDLFVQLRSRGVGTDRKELFTIKGSSVRRALGY